MSYIGLNGAKLFVDGNPVPYFSASVGSDVIEDSRLFLKIDANLPKLPRGTKCRIRIEMELGIREFDGVAMGRHGVFKLGKMCRLPHCHTHTQGATR